MQSTTRFCAMTLAAAGLLLMPAANAQNQSPSAPSATESSPTPSPANIPDNKLDAAAAVVKSLSTLKTTYEQKLAQAPAKEKNRILGEADDAMTKAVTDQGLSVEEYTKIMQMAQNDPTVRDKLIQRLKEGR